MIIGWLKKLHRTLELHKKIIPIIVVCFSILIVLTIIVTSYANYFFGIRHAKKSLVEKYEMVLGTIIKHGPVLDRMVGDKLQNYKIIREEFLRQQRDIRILRSEKIDELYGKEDPQYYPRDEIEKRALKEGLEIVIREGFILKGVFPVRASADCLRCHYNVSEKEILGAVSLVMPVKYIFDETKLVVIVYIFLGLGGIFTASLLVYFTYIKIAHQPLERVTKVLEKIAEGDLTVTIDPKLKDREDLIGRLINGVEKVLEYMKNFTSKTLDYSVKLIDQVDNVFKFVDNVNEKIKFQNLKVAQTSIVVDDFSLTIGAVSRNTTAITTLAKEIINELQKIDEKISQEKLKEITTKVLNLTDEILNKAIGIATEIEKGHTTSESINRAFEEIIQVSNEISQLMDRMSENAYETLLISSYMKTIASTVKTVKMEEMLFDLFEKDLDRYILRIQAHLKGIDRLDPERWGDYKAFPIGKWFYSEEGEKIRQMIKDFDFDEFDSVYQTLHTIGKEIIIAHNMEDAVKVEKLQTQLRSISRRLKLYLAELKEKYQKVLERGEK